MGKLVTGFVRAVYFVTGAGALLLTGLVCIQFAESLLQADGLDVEAFLLTAGTVIVYGLLPGRAMRRLARGGELIPAPLLRERAGIAALVTAAGLLGTYMLVILGIMFSRRLNGSMEDMNAAPALTLLLMSYAFALLTGEFVMVGNGRTDQQV